MEESNTRVFFFVKSLLSLEESRGGYHEHVYGVNLGYVRKHGGLIYSLDNGTVYKDLDPVKKQGIIPLIL